MELISRNDCQCSEKRVTGVRALAGACLLRVVACIPRPGLFMMPTLRALPEDAQYIAIRRTFLASGGLCQPRGDLPRLPVALKGMGLLYNGICFQFVAVVGNTFLTNNVYYMCSGLYALLMKLILYSSLICYIALRRTLIYYLGSFWKHQILSVPLKKC